MRSDLGDTDRHTRLHVKLDDIENQSTNSTGGRLFLSLDWEMVLNGFLKPFHLTLNFL